MIAPDNRGCIVHHLALNAYTVVAIKRLSKTFYAQSLFFWNQIGENLLGKMGVKFEFDGAFVACRG